VVAGAVVVIQGQVLVEQAVRVAAVVVVLA
jgi:hypothetical protein